MKLFLFCLLLSVFYILPAQLMYKPSAYEIKTLPEWAQQMYGKNPNVKTIDSLYTSYYKKNPFQKNYHTQYYKRWRRKVQNITQNDGFIRIVSEAEKLKIDQKYQAKISQHKNNKTSASNWTIAGPIQVFQNDGTPGNGQSNIYSIDQHVVNPQILYCGTENGEVFKSIDAGAHWGSVSLNETFGSGVTAIKIDPTNENIVFAAGNNGIHRTTNGGVSWDHVLAFLDQVNEFFINPDNTNIVLAATDDGLYRSTDGGSQWTKIFTEKCYDIKAKPFHNNVLYLVKNNPTLEICEFYKSTDTGNTWQIQSSGWYQSSDPARNDGGARLAISPADSNVVYAYLIGEAKANDYGFIGVYRSNDAGNTWILPNGPAGGPYTTNHQNLAIGGNGWNYHQGFYNCAIMVSDTNADVLLVGGLNVFRSTDGAQTFSVVSGYLGGPLNMHVDNQDFRMINGKAWITTDGGIYYSEDFFNTQPEFKMKGVRASEFWGFGSGWNEDVLTGGLYHNGNIAYHENYGAGNYLDLGGGEAPTGYVNPGNNRKAYFSDIGGCILPLSITDPVGTATFGKSPNETYYAVESSEMEFHPHCYNIAYIGNENSIWKTTDGGATFNSLFTFGTNPDEQVKYIEISSSNPDVIYLSQQSNVTWSGKLWKTNNGGINWTSLNIPSGNSRRMSLSINPSNENEIWMSYAEGSNGNKIYHSIDGGLTWNNLTTSMLDDESIQSLQYIAGTDGGIYICTDNTVYYKNNAMSNWQLENTGLPTYFNSNIARPFYRDGKIRIASYGKGIWESSLVENPDAVIARITLDKLSQNFTCHIDSFYFNDYSFINHQNASWNWSFQNGVPSTSTIKNPVVYFPTAGTFLVTLSITDGNGKTDTDSLYITINQPVIPTMTSENFEGNFLPTLWEQAPNGRWEQSLLAGGFGLSSKSAIFNNFSIDATGVNEDLKTFVNTSTLTDSILSFDVAHAYYGGQYNDSLEVLLSTDCGQTYTSVYVKGGNDLATVPNQTTTFTPTTNDWRKDSINISNFAGHPQLMIVFRNIGHWGNSTFIDNVNCNQSILNINPAQTNTITVYPNPVVSNGLLNINLPNNEICKLSLVNINGKTVWAGEKSGQSQIQLDFPAGNYILNIKSKQTIWNKKITIIQ